MKKHTRQANLNYDRRKFVKLGTLGGIALAMGSHSFATPQSATGQETSTAPTVVPPLSSVRVGFVGIGGMGSSHLRNLLKIEGVEIRAVCDIVEGKVASAQELVTRAGKPKPKGYCCGETGFRRLCEQEDLDGHALGMAYAGLPGGHEQRQARGHGDSCGSHAGGMLGASRNGREDGQILRHVGELLLRQNGTHDSE